MAVVLGAARSGPALSRTSGDPPIYGHARARSRRHSSASRRLRRVRDSHPGGPARSPDNGLRLRPAPDPRRRSRARSHGGLTDLPRRQVACGCLPRRALAADRAALPLRPARGHAIPPDSYRRRAPTVGDRRRSARFHHSNPRHDHKRCRGDPRRLRAPALRSTRAPPSRALRRGLPARPHRHRPTRSGRVLGAGQPGAVRHHRLHLRRADPQALSRHHPPRGRQQRRRAPSPAAGRRDLRLPDREALLQRRRGNDVGAALDLPRARP